jgi:hypothetical protein
MPENIPVISSNVQSVDVDGSTVAVQYKGGGTYDYFDVEPELITELRQRAAGEIEGSIGGFISKSIVRGHKFQKRDSQ